MKKIIASILIVVVITMDRLEAQNNQNSQLQNPYTLVYKGAIVENLEGKVNIHPVTYNNKDIVIVANVYTPANFDASKKYATIVIAAKIAITTMTMRSSTIVNPRALVCLVILGLPPN